MEYLASLIPSLILSATTLLLSGCIGWTDPTMSVSVLEAKYARLKSECIERGYLELFAQRQLHPSGIIHHRRVVFNSTDPNASAESI
jgi:hypothetical protein